VVLIESGCTEHRKGAIERQGSQRFIWVSCSDGTSDWVINIRVSPFPSACQSSSSGWSHGLLLTWGLLEFKTDDVLFLK
jgi:hypothetical protein